jgi:hypothetical protein
VHVKPERSHMSRDHLRNASFAGRVCDQAGVHGVDGDELAKERKTGIHQWQMVDGKW